MRKTLIDKIKKAVYIPITATALTLLSHTPTLGQTRTTETEDFNTASISRSYIHEYPEKVFLRNNRLEIEDWTNLWGYNNTTFNDKLYDMTKNMSLEVTIDRTLWKWSTTHLGIIFASDPLSKNYYFFDINALPGKTQQWGVRRENPHENLTYLWKTTKLLNTNGPNTIKVTYDSSGYHFFINNTLVYTNNPTTEPRKFLQIPQLNGYSGLLLFDGSGTEFGDPPLDSISSFDDFIVSYDQTGGGGAKRVKEEKIAQKADNSLKPHIPEVFIRGDVNRDRQVNISDAISLLNFLFKGGPLAECPDSADLNDDGSLDISDPIYELLYLYKGMKIPSPAPSQSDYGMDITKDSLPKCNGYDVNPWEKNK